MSERMREFWEVIQAKEVKVGDMIKFASYDSGIVREIRSDGSISLNGTTIFPLDAVLRRVFYDYDPKVLQKAFELMAHDVVDRGEIHDEELDAAVRGVCRDYLAIARKEISGE